MNSSNIILKRLAVLLGLAVITGSGMAVAIPASAQTTAIHIAGTAGQGVRLREAPNTSGAILATIPEGAAPPIQCAVSGQSVSGVSIWMKTTWSGRTGFFSSFYDDSHYSSWADLHNRYGIDQCAPSNPTSPPASTGANAVQQSAMNWAKARVGRSEYAYWCLKFAFDAYSQAGRNVRSQVSRPIDNNTYPVDIWGHFSAGRTGGGTPPAGALVFYAAKSGDRTFSHVTLSVGGGNTVSTADSLGKAIHYETVAQHAYANYLGWWLPAS